MYVQRKTMGDFFSGMTFGDQLDREAEMRL